MGIIKLQVRPSPNPRVTSQRPPRRGRITAVITVDNKMQLRFGKHSDQQISIRENIKKRDRR